MPTSVKPKKRATLRRYLDSKGQRREIVAHRTGGGATLVVDRAVSAGAGGRLVAHLASDEPSANAAVACELFLAEPPERRTCRRLTADDLLEVASTALDGGEGTGVVQDDVTAPQTIEVGDERYAIQPVDIGISIPAARWCRLDGAADPETAVSLRDVVGRAEAYEPAHAITLRALEAYSGSHTISTAILRAELERLSRSRIVLNRLLRETVIAAVARGDVSMSEIAIRCGRQKRDSRGNISGETSWLSRRLGLLPEGGCRRPTPWIHSDVLAVIARRGLGVSPREVEL